MRRSADCRYQRVFQILDNVVAFRNYSPSKLKFSTFWPRVNLGEKLASVQSERWLSNNWRSRWLFHNLLYVASFFKPERLKLDWGRKIEATLGTLNSYEPFRRYFTPTGQVWPYWPAFFITDQSVGPVGYRWARPPRPVRVLFVFA